MISAQQRGEFPHIQLPSHFNGCKNFLFNLVFLQSEKRSLTVNTRHSLRYKKTPNQYMLQFLILWMDNSEVHSTEFLKSPYEIEHQLPIVINSSVPITTEFSFFSPLFYFPFSLTFFHSPITSKISYLCTVMSFRHRFRVMKGRDKDRRK